jgi:hypothetical protein
MSVRAQIQKSARILGIKGFWHFCQICEIPLFSTLTVHVKCRTFFPYWIQSKSDQDSNTYMYIVNHPTSGTPSLYFYVCASLMRLLVLFPRGITYDRTLLFSVKNAVIIYESLSSSYIQYICTYVLSYDSLPPECLTLTKYAGQFCLNM